MINPEWLQLHWPAYWHYDVLQGLRAIAAAGLAGDERIGDALDHLQAQRGADGKWRAHGQRYWRLNGQSNVELVDWGDAAEVLTAQGAEVLRAAAPGLGLVLRAAERVGHLRSSQ